MGILIVGDLQELSICSSRGIGFLGFLGSLQVNRVAVLHHYVIGACGQPSVPPISVPAVVFLPGAAPDLGARVCVNRTSQAAWPYWLCLQTANLTAKF